MLETEAQMEDDGKVDKLKESEGKNSRQKETRRVKILRQVKEEGQINGVKEKMVKKTKHKGGSRCLKEGGRR